MAADLENEFTEEEVFLVIKSLDLSKYPSIDGFAAEFFKHSWHTIKSHIMTMIREFFNSSITNTTLNETYICLIPKKLDAKSIIDYRPISLIPCAYKIIASVLSNRLKHVLPHTIVENQMAFVAHRQILDASLIANKVIDDWNISKKEGVILKLDMGKAFDEVD